MIFTYITLFWSWLAVIQTTPTENEGSVFNIPTTPGTSSSGAGLNTAATPDQISMHCASVMSDNAVEQLKATQQFRRLLSIGKAIKLLILTHVEVPTVWLWIYYTNGEWFVWIFC